MHSPIPKTTISSLVPTIAALGAFLLLEPVRPLFFWLAGETVGFQLFLVVRVVALACAIVIAARSTLTFEWKPRTVPVAIDGADPLQTLRGFACLIVLMGHGTAIIFAPADTAELVHSNSPFRLAMVCPWLGVWIFFVLSGYLMGKGFYAGRYEVSRKGILRFYRNRLLRIAPVYWAAILIVAAIQSPYVFQPENLLGLLSSLLFFQSTETPFVVIGALWSVQTEMAFYLVVPFVFAALATIIKRGANPAWVLGAFVVAGLAYRIAGLLAGKLAGVNIWNAAICVPTIANMDLFAAGILTNWLMAHPAKQISGRFLAAGICAALFIASAILFSAGQVLEGKRELQALVVLGPAAVAILTSVAIISLETKRPHGAIVTATQWVGTLTYVVYVVHEPVYNAVRAWTPAAIDAPQSLALTVIAIVATALIATAAYFVAERPFNGLKARAS